MANDPELSDEAKSPELPASIGRYAIVRQIGRGGFADVYLARDPETGAPVALKVLRDDIDSRVREQVRTRFLAEEAIARAIAHPAIVTIRETSARGERPCFIAMDYVDGLPFCEYFAHVRASAGTAFDTSREGEQAYVAEVCRLGHQVARAMAVAHSRHIVHRDLKPDNVLVVADGASAHVRILDFGIAKAPANLFSLERAAHVTRYYTELGTVMGSPPYMAPEQNGAAHGVSGKADVFALGVMLLVTLLGLPARALEQGERHLALPADFDELVAGSAIGRGLRTLLRAMVDEDPERRPPMHEVALQLQREARSDAKFAAAVEAWVRDGRVPAAGQLLSIARRGMGELVLTDDEEAFLRTAPLKKLEQMRRRLGIAMAMAAMLSVGTIAFAAYTVTHARTASAPVVRAVSPRADAVAPSPDPILAPPAPSPAVHSLKAALDTQELRLKEEHRKAEEQRAEIKTLQAALAEQRRGREQAQRQVEQLESRATANETGMRECRSDAERQGQALAECRRDVEAGLAQLVESAERLRLCTRSLREQSLGARANPPSDTMMD